MIKGEDATGAEETNRMSDSKNGASVSATGSQAEQRQARPVRARSAALLLAGVTVLFSIGMVVARSRSVPTTTGAATTTVPRAVGTPGPRVPIQRIAGLAELPPGPVEHVEVAYFHRTHRCSGCINAERLTRETLDTRFADRLRSGDLNLVVDDTEAPADPALVRRYEAWGSALYLSVAKGGTAYTWRVDDIWFYVNEEQKFIGILADAIRVVYGES